MSENGEIYTAGKNFTLPPALTALKIPPLRQMSIILCFHLVLGSFQYHVINLLTVFMVSKMANSLSVMLWTDFKWLSSLVNGFPHSGQIDL